MNSRIRLVLAGFACALACAVATAQTSSPSGDAQISGPAPSQSHVWMSGHWNSEGGQWTWAAAHWELPPSRSAVWVGGHWISSGGNWVWVNGAWNISDGQQAQSAPPQPPGTGMDAQGTPSPTSAAPYVDGQYQGAYGPGGVNREVYLPAGTTDYGPLDASQVYYPAYDYAYGYPAYGWGAYPAYWGLPGIALGFGWGPRFGGWGHGGFGHGGFGHPGGHGAVGHTNFTHGGSSGHFGH